VLALEYILREIELLCSKLHILADLRLNVVDRSFEVQECLIRGLNDSHIAEGQ
jgi:hypothetical protein